jgi:kynurenine formamidase
MRIIDVTGPIETGMWSYGPPYPEVLIEEIEQPEFVEHETYSWRFELGAQTGTYLETSLHVRRDGPELIEVPVEELVMRDAAILRVPCEPDQRIERRTSRRAASMSPGRCGDRRDRLGQPLERAGLRDQLPVVQLRRDALDTRP